MILPPENWMPRFSEKRHWAKEVPFSPLVSELTKKARNTQRARSRWNCLFQSRSKRRFWSLPSTSVEEAVVGVSPVRKRLRKTMPAVVIERATSPSSEPCPKTLELPETINKVCVRIQCINGWQWGYTHAYRNSSFSAVWIPSSGSRKCWFWLLSPFDVRS